MGEIRQPPVVQLTMGLLLGQEASLDMVKARLEKEFGPVERQSEPIDFTYTDYYQDELGSQVQRLFLAFQQFVSSADLPFIKNRTNAIEMEMAVAGKRRVNIDPGYITPSKLVLATTKDGSYRVYLDKGIYAQPMLYFEKGTFHPWTWAYPDYKDHSSIAFFTEVRNRFQEKSREGNLETMKLNQPPARWNQSLPYLIVMLFFVMGPFALPRLWRSPALKKNMKWLMTLLTLFWTVYIIYYMADKLRPVLDMYKELGQTLSNAGR